MGTKLASNKLFKCIPAVFFCDCTKSFEMHASLMEVIMGSLMILRQGNDEITFGINR
jgi:hypothetical protein